MRLHYLDRAVPAFQSRHDKTSANLPQLWSSAVVYGEFLPELRTSQSAPLKLTEAAELMGASTESASTESASTECRQAGWHFLGQHALIDAPLVRET